MRWIVGLILTGCAQVFGAVLCGFKWETGLVVMMSTIIGILSVVADKAMQSR